MTMNLYKSTSPSNKIGKTLVSVFPNVSGYLKEATSIIDPVIVLETSVPASVISGVNYADITEFGRKYFVTNIISLSNDLWELHMHVDVLDTYQTQIKAQTAVVARQQKKYNMMLDDGWFMAYQNPITEKKVFSNTTPFNVDEFVLILAGS